MAENLENRKKQITTEDLFKEFKEWKIKSWLTAESTFNAEVGEDDVAFSKFLLARPDDGSRAFANDMEGTINRNNNEIVTLVKAGKMEEAKSLP